MVFFRVSERWGEAAEFSAALQRHGLLMNATGPTTLRAVTHLDVTTADVERAIEILKRVATRR
jgi:threonine aldolase